LCHPVYNKLEDLEKGEEIINKQIYEVYDMQKERELIKEIA
jgi:hypothetical protein